MTLNTITDTGTGIPATRNTVTAMDMSTAMDTSIAMDMSTAMDTATDTPAKICGVRPGD
jgi:hypothetical protein